MEPFGAKPKVVPEKLKQMSEIAKKDPMLALGLSILDSRESNTTAPAGWNSQPVPESIISESDSLDVTKLEDGTVVDNVTGEVLYAPRHNLSDSMTLGEKLEYVFDCKMEVAELEYQIKKIKENYAKFEWEILEEMQEKDLEKIECSRGSATSKTEPYPNLKDHLSFFEWVAETKSFEFLEKRCAKAAVKDMLATQGILPPGIDTYMKTSLSVRKKAVRRSK